jgi:diaminohydroxyphosphoribosylaminopyrimidine deaminase/5-amino-6-(5-phosphoribosylamino)uracil reductase
MKRAFMLAEKGAGKTAPNPMVGAVIVKDGRIIGEGWHERYGQAHAEVNAIKTAKESVEGATVYVNLEPCCHYGKTPPCTELLINSRVKRVVIGSLDPNPLVAGKGAQRLRDAGIQVTEDVLQAESLRLNEVFFHFIRTGRPFVIVKSAVSLDGKIACATGESKWVTGETARADVQQLRSRYSSIMVGADTVIRDDPQLTCRLKEGRNPRRIILDSSLRIPIESRVLTDQDRNPTLMACTERASPEAIKRFESLGAHVLLCKSRNGRVDLQDLMEKLGAASVDSILLEGGGQLNEVAFAQGIVNKVVLYMAAKVFGGAEAKTFVEGIGIDHPDQAYPFRFDMVENIGDDLKITAYPKGKGDGTCSLES